MLSTWYFQNDKKNIFENDIHKTIFVKNETLIFSGSNKEVSENRVSHTAFIVDGRFNIVDR